MRNATRKRIGHLIRLVAIVGLALTASAVSAGVNTWTTSGPEGGVVRVLAIDPANPETLYAFAWGAGVFKSTNGGGSWRAVNAGLTNLDVLALAIHPSAPGTLYAGTSGGGVFKSTNGGENWRAINAGLTYVLDLAIDPSAPATIYAAGTAVFKSTDGGDSWTTTGPDRFVSALAIDPSAPATIYAAGYQGVFKSTDGGRSWEISSENLNGLAISALAVDPTAPASLYAATWCGFDCLPGGVYKSTDGGATWTRRLRHRSASAVVITGRGTVYAGTSEGLSRSDNHGSTWISYTNLSGSVLAIAIDPSDTATLYTGTGGGGILKSSNGGGSWTAANGGLIASIVPALAIDPSAPATLYAGTQGGGVSKSSNGGGSWTAINAGLTSPYVNALAIDPSAPATLYAGTRDGVFKSTNGGASWTAISEGLTHLYVSALAVDPSAPATLYAGTSPADVFKSTDGGASWAVAGVLPAEYHTVYGLVVDPSAPATVYALTNDGVFKSVDAGASWTQSGLSSLSISALTIDPSAPATLYAGTFDGVFKSVDGGGSWTFIAGFPGIVTSWAIDPSAPATLYAGTSGGGVFVSTDGGASWAADINAGLTNTNILALALDPSTPARLYAGTSGGGVFERDLQVSSPCSPTATRLCLVGNRYAVDLVASHRGVNGPGAARPLGDRAGYFGFPFATGDPDLPEVVVKMLADGTFGPGGAPIFFSSLTSLPFVLTVTDTVTGRVKTYPSNPNAPFCGDTDLVVGEVRGSMSPRRAAAAAEGALLLLGGRFSVTLEARHPRDGRIASGLVMASADRFGFFSLPDVTGNPEFPEVFVKMVDARWLAGKFWFFHTGLTSLDYTLTVTDSVTGTVQTYESSTPFCGAADTHTFEDSPSFDLSGEWTGRLTFGTDFRLPVVSCSSSFIPRIVLGHEGTPGTQVTGSFATNCVPGVRNIYIRGQLGLTKTNGAYPLTVYLEKNSWVDLLLPLAPRLTGGASSTAIDLSSSGGTRLSLSR